MNQHITPVYLDLIGPCPAKTWSFCWIWWAVTSKLTHMLSKMLTLIFTVIIVFSRCLANKQETQLWWWLLVMDQKSKAETENVFLLSASILQPRRSGKLLYLHIVTATYSQGGNSWVYWFGPGASCTSYGFIFATWLQVGVVACFLLIFFFFFLSIQWRNWLCLPEGSTL